MASTSNVKATMRLSKKIKEHLFKDQKAIQAYIEYLSFGKVFPIRVAIFEDFPTYDLFNLCLQNELV